jgi:tetratricopeptide (TPR) repeat protein
MTSLLRGLGRVCFAAGMFSLSGCEKVGYAEDCERGYKHAYDGAFADAKTSLQRCLDGQHISSSDRRQALIAQAWTQSSLDDEFSAAQSYDQAFGIAPATTYHEMINASLTYKHVTRYKDALQLNIAAAELDGGKHAESMMIQYHLGWAYQLNDRHEDAVKAFSKGIAQQPDFAYAFWRRALSHEALANNEKAKADLVTASILFVNPESNEPIKDTLRKMHHEIADAYKRFGLDVPIAVSRALAG